MQTPPYQLPDMPAPAEWESLDPERAMDRLFEPLRAELGRDGTGYRNHCLRAEINVRALAPDLDGRLVIPALAFHDIALFTHRTVDYLEPSAAVAAEYLERHDRAEHVPQVVAMIEWHHEQRRYTGPHAEWVEPVRRADMADFTFGLQGRVPRSALRDGRGRYPNAGFHAMLLRRTLGRLARKPWSPLPMMRW